MKCPWTYVSARGVIFDMRHKADGEEITVADMEACLGNSGATLDKGVITNP
jgi:hypothetical protein